MSTCRGRVKVVLHLLLVSHLNEAEALALRTDDLPRPGRPARGVAIRLPQNMGAKIVRRYVQDELNALWVRIPNSVDIVAVYVRPGAEREAFRCFMEDVRRRARYPFVMAGDFNARHKIWCTKNNPNGKTLYDWSKEL